MGGTLVYKNPEARSIWLHILLIATYDYVKVKSGNKFIELFTEKAIFGKRCWDSNLRAVYYLCKGRKIKAYWCTVCGELRTENGLRIWRGRIGK